MYNMILDNECKWEREKNREMEQAVPISWPETSGWETKTAKLATYTQNKTNNMQITLYLFYVQGRT